MTQILALAAFLLILVHDLFGGALLAGSPRGAWVVAATLAPLALLAAAVHAVSIHTARRLDRGAPFRAANTAEGALGAARLVGGACYAGGVLILGWPDVVRGAMGNTILLDELVIAAPFLAFLVVGWVSIWGVDRRLREATMLKHLDDGAEPVPPLGAAAFVLMSTRHHLLLVLVPVAMVMAWTELVDRGLGAIGSRLERGGGLPAWLGSMESASAAAALAQLAGIAAIVVLSPLLLRRLWSTSPLAGPLRDTLVGMARRYGVRLGRPLVWRTHGLMVNGAILGAFWPARYLLLTDALLEHLSAEQIEAVAAHEIGHARLRHLLWLGAAVIATLQAVGVGAHWLGVRGDEASAAAGATLVLSLAAAAGVFTCVSRVFEWQADAFAVRHLSLTLPAPLPGRAPAMTEHAATIMTAALRNVAEWNGVPVGRPSWRHGSIALRQQKLWKLVGVPVDELPIDRRVRRIKGATAVALAAGVGAMFLLPL
ncbi:MAG: hypothetical protein FJ255_02490 [Phycisphaerae bacterium]|nr:hypothetical protein [Phycisphaerae bacterium]